MKVTGDPQQAVLEECWGPESTGMGVREKERNRIGDSEC